MGRGFRSATNLIPWLHAVRFVKLFLPWSKRPDSYFCSDALDWNHQTPGTHLPKRWPPVSRLRSASKECLKYMVMPQGLLAPRLTVGIFNYQFLFFSVYLILIYWHSKFVDVLLKKKCTYLISYTILNICWILDDFVWVGSLVHFVLVHLSRLLLWFQEQTFYYENIEGGHGGAADNKQRATWWHPKRHIVILGGMFDCQKYLIARSHIVIPNDIYSFV